MSEMILRSTNLGSQARTRMKRVLFVPGAAWRTLLITSALAFFALAPVWWRDSVWLGVGLVFSLIVVVHGLLASRVVPWIPGLIALVACLQWVIAAWAGYHVPPVFALFKMVIPPGDYFSYAVPAVLLLTLGLFLPLRGFGRQAPPSTPHTLESSPRLLATLRWMVIIGALVRVLVVPNVPGSMGFLALLVANLAFVGFFGMVLVRAPRWPLYGAVVLGLQAMYSSADGMFHELLLWSTYLVAILAFTHRLRLRVLITAGVLALLLIFTLNAIKQEYRYAIGSQKLSLGRRTALLGETLLDRVLHPGELFTEEKVGLNVARTNQGWIIARTLSYTPAAEPFAEGETVRTAVAAALLPRFLNPGKYQAGGGEYVTRFAGVEIRGGTSMSLSLAGEMYVNFDRYGGLAGMFVIGLLLGLLYRLFYRWSHDSILWWAWAPYVMLSTMQAESGLAEALNHVVKSSIVMFAAIGLMPAWSMLRRWKRPRRRAVSVS